MNADIFQYTETGRRPWPEQVALGAATVAFTTPVPGAPPVGVVESVDPKTGKALIVAGGKRYPNSTITGPGETNRSFERSLTGREAPSWVIRNKETKEVIMETYDPKKVAALNTSKYEAVPIGGYLASLNITEGDAPASPEIGSAPVSVPVTPEYTKV